MSISGHVRLDDHGKPWVILYPTGRAGEEDTVVVARLKAFSGQPSPKVVPVDRQELLYVEPWIIKCAVDVRSKRVMPKKDLYRVVAMLNRQALERVCERLPEAWQKPR